MIEYWQWLCGNCKVRKSGLPSRAEAIRLGREHIDEKHADDDQWQFRIQGISPGKSFTAKEIADWLRSNAEANSTRVAVAQYLDQLANLVDEGALEEAHA